MLLNFEPEKMKAAEVKKKKHKSAKKSDVQFAERSNSDYFAWRKSLIAGQRVKVKFSNKATGDMDWYKGTVKRDRNQIVVNFDNNDPPITVTRSDYDEQSIISL